MQIVVLEFAYAKCGCSSTNPNPFFAGTRAFVHGGHSNFVLDDLFALDLYQRHLARGTLTMNFRVREKSERSATAIAAVISHVNDCESFRHCCNLNLRVVEQQIMRSRQMQTASHCHINHGKSGQVHTAGSAPQPRHSHAAASHGGHIWLFGGVDALGAPAATLHRLPLQAPDAPALLKCALCWYQLGHRPAVKLSAVRLSVCTVRRRALKIMAGH